ncbi:MAG: type III pantothenate kinase [Phocaeicola sp.]
MNLVIDIGNSTAKLAVFKEDQLMEIVQDSNQSFSQLYTLCEKYPIKQGIISSVVTYTPEIEQELKRLPFTMLYFTHLTPIPIQNNYQTPQTLGMDRLAGVIGANYLRPHSPLLVIDAGTCITYDFLDASEVYHGGNISPGVQMRIKALNNFTSKLPLITEEGETPLCGYNTETAIRSGVLKGIEFELIGYIEQLKKLHPGLFVFLTGGTEFSFDSNLKSIIFADRFLVLKGLNRILRYNDKL